MRAYSQRIHNLFTARGRKVGQDGDGNVSKFVSGGQQAEGAPLPQLPHPDVGRYAAMLADESL